MSWTMRVLFGLLLLGSLALNACGVGWGMPNDWVWSADSIAGERGRAGVDALFGRWVDRYPPFHFLVLSPVFPASDALASVFGSEPHPDDERVAVRQWTRTAWSIVLARLVAALMGAGTVLAVVLAGRELFGELRAGLIAGLYVSLSQLFVFFSQVGNVDGPMVFWFAWAVWAGARCSSRGSRGDFARLGIFAALAISTKEPAAGYLLGLAVAVLIARATDPTHRPWSIAAALSAALRGRVWIAFWLFWLGFLLFDVLPGGGPWAYSRRVEYWQEATPHFSRGLDLLQLSSRSLEQLQMGLGLPLVALAGVSVPWTILRRPRQSLWVCLPPLAFLVTILLPIGYVYPRFLLPVIPCVALACGFTCSEWLGRPSPWARVRAVPLVAIFGISLLYCIGLELEMRADSRVRAADWLDENVAAGEDVAALGWRWGLPVIESQTRSPDYRIDRGRKIAFELLEEAPAYPRYLVLSQESSGRWRFEDPRLYDALHSGRCGYEIAAAFERLYLDPRRTFLGLAGWEQGAIGWVSPKVTILRRNLPERGTRRRLSSVSKARPHPECGFGLKRRSRR